MLSPSSTLHQNVLFFFKLFYFIHKPCEWVDFWVVLTSLQTWIFLFVGGEMLVACSCFFNQEELHPPLKVVQDTSGRSWRSGACQRPQEMDQEDGERELLPSRESYYRPKIKGRRGRRENLPPDLKSKLTGDVPGALCHWFLILQGSSNPV